MNARVPRYHRIAESLRDRIHAGRLTPGTRLDNQRQLAKSFGYPEASAADSDVPLPRKKSVPTRAEGKSVSTTEPGSRAEMTDLPGAMTST